MAQSQSQMILYIPFTFGDNGKRKGTTEEQIFWHMRNARIGHIDHIDCKEWTNSKGINVRSWFVHFSQWQGGDDLTEALDNGGHFEIDYDDYGHFWKVMKYTPRDTTDKEKRNAVFIRTLFKLPLAQSEHVGSGSRQRSGDIAIFFCRS